MTWLCLQNSALIETRFAGNESYAFLLGPLSIYKLVRSLHNYVTIHQASMQKAYCKLKQLLTANKRV